MYGTYLPHRSRWAGMSREERHTMLQHHASRHWEQFCRQRHPGAGRYWEGAVELDFVWRQKTARRHLIAECKWTALSPRESQRQLAALRERFAQTKLSRFLGAVAFRLFTPGDLPHLLESTPW